MHCEHQDALDALNEMIGRTVDFAWDAVNTVGKQARNVLVPVLRHCYEFSRLSVWS